MEESPYKETLSFLFSRLPMYQRVGAKAFKKDLTNIRELLEAVGNPHRELKTIHVAGTNGKGTVSFLLAAILQAQGYKTGLYVSPHYVDFRERIRINGTYITKGFVVNFVETNRKAIEDISPSFFEISVAMAFAYFQKQKVDIAVIETGLGGRLDSTNVLYPLLSVITNIGLDHTNFLGDTLQLIAGEKAGIIKRHIPVVIGKRQQETTPVFLKKAEELNSKITFAEEVYHVKALTTGGTSTKHEIYKNGRLLYPLISVDLSGPFQEENIQTTLAAIDVLRDNYLEFPVSDKAILSGLEKVKSLTKYIGRWHKLGSHPTIIADSAHNPAALKVVIAQLLSLPFNQLHIVLGMVNDKDVNNVLSLLPKDAVYYFAKADIPRGLDAELLQQQAKKYHLKGTSYSSVNDAFVAAKSAAKIDDFIFIGGSVFVVAEII